MLINLESHINMKHTQARRREKKWKISGKRVEHHEVMSVRLMSLIFNPKQTIEREMFILIKKSGEASWSSATLNTSSIKSFGHDWWIYPIKELMHSHTLIWETCFSLCCVLRDDGVWSSRMKKKKYYLTRLFNGIIFFLSY